MSCASSAVCAATIANGTTNSKPIASVSTTASSVLRCLNTGRRSSQPNAGHSAMAITTAHTTAGMNVRAV